ncbi:MAG: diphthine-ammonia ligase [Archaeoglobi archaeon]|nr:diphthine-ammonia ligase [Archaeoglobi archaeon]
MRSAALFSGGKDSTYAVYLAEKEGFAVEHLIIVEPEEDSMMFHFPCIELAEKSAELMGKECTAVRISREDEEDMEAIGNLLRELEVEALISGAVASSYQRSRIERLCSSLGILPVMPLWGRDPFETLREMLSLGFEIMIVGCFAEGMGRELLGRIIDFEILELLKDLHERYGVHPGGEGGEFETFVLSGPHMEGRIEFDYEVIWRGDSGYLIPKNVRVLGRSS